MSSKVELTAQEILNPAKMPASRLTAIIRAWLDASPATEWGAYEWALDAAIAPEEGDAAAGNLPG